MIKKVWFIALSISLVSITSLVPHVSAKEKIKVGAESAIMMDMDSKKVLFTKNANKKMKIASITKIMTAILAIENATLDQVVNVKRSAVGVEGSSIFLKEGEKISMQTLLYGLMLRSGNDAATAIAEQVGGSEEGFVYLMNQKAEYLGMKNTHFSNPHGLDEKDHYSTAQDMAILTAYAMKHSEFSKIVSTKVAKVDWPDVKWKKVFRNKNKFLNMYAWADGVKTGYTKKSGRSLVTTAKKNGKHLVCVTINDPDDWRDHEKMFNDGFQQLGANSTVSSGKKVMRTSIRNLQEQELYIIAKRDFNLSLNQQQMDEVTTRAVIAYPLQHVKHSGEKVGQLQIYWRDQLLDSVPLISHWSAPMSLLTGWKQVMKQFLSPGVGLLK